MTWSNLKIIMTLEHTRMDMERIPEYINIFLETYSDFVVSRGNTVTLNRRDMNREKDIYEGIFAGKNFSHGELEKSADISYRGHLENGCTERNVYVVGLCRFQG